MRINMSMNREEEKFAADSWWATKPEFVLYTLRSQLRAASVIWPELAVLEIGLFTPPESGKSVETPAAEKKDE